MKYQKIAKVSKKSQQNNSEKVTIKNDKEISNIKIQKDKHKQLLTI